MQRRDGFLIQFLRLAGPFWNSENKLAIRLNTACLILLTVLQMGIAVVITEWNADLFDDLEKRSMSGLRTQIILLGFIFIANIVITTAHLIVKRRLLIGWRLWLTKKVIAKWMCKGRHYQLTFMSQGDFDNPDGRIAEDIRIATEEAIALWHSLFYSLLLLVSFTEILWKLSGTVVFSVGIYTFSVVGYLVWISIIYAVFASLLGRWMGKSLSVATNARQSKEANYRHDLIKAQENSQAIALIQGEENEQERFLDSFRAIIASYRQQTAAWKQIQMFTTGYSVTSMALPILVVSPRYIAGAITLGTLMQSVQAFQQMVSALSWPVNSLAEIANWRASVERVLGLVKALDELDHDISCLNSHQICVEKTEKSVLKFTNLSLANLQNETLSETLNYEIKQGERVIISGQASLGAKLFKAIAGLWPWGSGHIEVPANEDLFFMPPIPYLPTGTLFEAIAYPKTIAAYDRPDLESLLRRVGLRELVKQLDHTESWEQVLSREQQQRLGLIRVLLHRAHWIFIQQAMDSLSPNDEIKMLEFLAKELPEAAILSITNQPMAEAFHQHKLKI